MWIVDLTKNNTKLMLQKVPSIEIQFGLKYSILLLPESSKGVAPCLKIVKKNKGTDHLKKIT